VLAPGEVVVLAMPDAAADRSPRRPSLTVDGVARVTALRGDGSVALDALVRDRVAVPPGTALLAAQPAPEGDGAKAARDRAGDGLAGWHARTRLCTLGSHAALGPGCVLTVEGTPAVPGTVWTTAAHLLARASAVRTRFARPIRTVVVVVAAAPADRLLGLRLELTGARRATDAAGVERPPTVLLSGAEAVLVYAVEPVAGASVAVRVLAGGDWRVTGVLGGDVDAAAVSADIVRSGLVATAGRVLPGATGTGCRIGWREGEQK
jgi:hypothetical protein